MGAYDYTALDAHGKNVKGVLHADTAKQVRQLLRDQKLIPLSVDESKKKLSSTSRMEFANRLSTNHLILFTRQLATMIQAGEPLDSAMDSIANEFGKGYAHKLIQSLRSAILEGHDLATALMQYKRQFPDFYIATISAGMHSGKLGMILERLADYMEYRQQQKQKMMFSLMYPGIVSVVAILVIVALMTYVVPQVITVYEQIDQQLPPLTQILIASSTFLRQNMLAIVGVLLTAFMVLGYLYRIESIRFQVHRTLLNTPLLGNLLTNIQVSRFSRTLSILLSSGVAIVEAINIAAEVINMLPMKQRAMVAATQVREGVSIRKALGDTRDFPSMSLQLIHSGENSGKLDEMLERSAQSQDKSVELKLNLLLGLFEPLLILAMGGFVLVIVLAILLPIFDLNQMVSV